MRTRLEQETIIRWDEEDKRIDLYTASRLVADRLRKRGYPLEPITTSKGEVTGWRCLAPENALTFRRIVSGVVPKPIHHPEGGTLPRRADQAIGRKDGTARGKG